jgi:hypothetical protein
VVKLFFFALKHNLVIEMLNMANAHDKFSNTNIEQSSTRVFHKKHVVINVQLFFTFTQTPPKVREVS